MTWTAFLSLAFLSLSQASPAAQEQQQQQQQQVTWSSSADAATITSSPCRSGHTICVDIYNGCGFKTGGCYDKCSPMPYTDIPLCTSSPPDVIPTRDATTSRKKAGVFTEKLVIIKGSLKTSSSSGAHDNFTTGSVVPSESATSPEPLPLSILPSTTSASWVSVSTTGVGDDDPSEDISTASMPTITPSAVAPTADTTSSLTGSTSSQAACGKKTKCYDYITSMNAVCPSVRYGGCIDICKDPKTQFTPKCRARRAAGKWILLP